MIQHGGGPSTLAYGLRRGYVRILDPGSRWRFSTARSSLDGTLLETRGCEKLRRDRDVAAGSALLNVPMSGWA